MKTPSQREISGAVGSPAYVELLQRELAARQVKNPKYSLRSFARSLKVSASILSRVMRGESQMSMRTCSVVAKHLGLDQFELKIFVDSVVHANQLSDRTPPSPVPVKSFHVGELSTLFEFRNMVISSALNMKSCDGYPESIAQLTGLSRDIVQSHLDENVKAGLFSKVGGKYVVQVHDQVHFDVTDSTWPVLRKSVVENLEIARQTVEQAKFGETNGTISVFSCKKGDRKRLVSRLRAFQRRLEKDFMSDDGDGLLHMVFHVGNIKKLDEGSR